MQTVDIHAARSRLSRLIDEAAGGDEIVITRAGTPVARLVPLIAVRQKPNRVLGLMAGQMRVSGDFDAPLPDDIIDALDGR
jgi:prevent-host-death family protein